MILEKDIIEIEIPDFIVNYARRIGKKFVQAKTPSQFRHVEDRGDTVNEDAFVGCMAHYAYLRHMQGPEGMGKLFDAYWVSNHFPEIRQIRKTKLVSDGGSDILRLNVDVKSSLVRTNLPIIRHRLPVRPHDRRENWVYVLVLITERKKENPTLDDAYNYTGHVVGWAKDSDLPNVTYDKEQGTAPAEFHGAYLMAAESLNPFPPFKWEF
jgi:hypothetical protein